MANYRQIDADTFQDSDTGETFRLAGANAAESYTPEGKALAVDPTILARINASTPTRLGQDYYGRTVARFTQQRDPGRSASTRRQPAANR